MAILTWDKYIIPCLRVLSDGQIHRRRDVVQETADLSGLTEEDRAERIRSGQPRYINRVNRVLMHLKDANAISSPARGMWQITDEGRRCQRSLKSSPKRSSKSSPPGKEWMGDFIGGMGADPIPAWAGSVIEEDRR